MIIFNNKSSMMRCPTGHLFDTKIHGSTCPYCPNPKIEPKDLSKFAPNSFTNTSIRLSRCPEGHWYNTTRHGELCPYCPKLEEDITEQEEPAIPAVAPVVGWLICVKGVNRGRDYRLIEGKNFIGRAQDMHVRILGDMNISKSKHTGIVFEPKKEAYKLLPGETEKLVYLNGEAIYEIKELEDYSFIELGKSKFIFLGLCRGRHSWQEKTEIKGD